MDDAPGMRASVGVIPGLTCGFAVDGGVEENSWTNDSPVND